MKRVGFVGLGAIGRPMARRLLDGGFEVAVFDVVPEHGRELVGLGALEARSPGEAASDADATVVMVATPDQALEAILGEGGAASGLSEDGTLILTSTVGPKTVREIRRRLGGRGDRLLDAPVSGGTDRARTGELLIMVGGEERVFASARPVLDAMGSKIEWIGREVGAGQSMKMVNQLLCGVHLAAAGEALAFAGALGLDPRRTYDVVSQGAANSFMMDDRAPRMLGDGPVSVESAMDIFVKDLGLVLEAAEEQGFRTLLASAGHRAFVEGASLGFGVEDDSRVVRVFDQQFDERIEARGG